MTAPKAKVGKNCNHGPNGRCLHCPVDEEIKEKAPVKSRCNHGPNGRCLHCPEEEDKNKEKYVKKLDKGKCDHGPNAKCLNCIEHDVDNVKHISFDSFIDKNYSRCQNHSGNQKCNKCVLDLEFDYKIKMDCKNHEPYPKGMCTKCLPPLIKMKRQQYRHVDYTQFMNKDEIQNLIQFWLKNLSHRIAYLYGYYAEDPIYPKGVRAVLETLYEPSQEGNIETVIPLNDPFQENIDKIAAALGLQRIGWLFTSFK